MQVETSSAFSEPNHNYSHATRTRMTVLKATQGSTFPVFTLTQLASGMRLNCAFLVCFCVLPASELGVRFSSFEHLSTSA